jgi:hypothetical protein
MSFNTQLSFTFERKINFLFKYLININNSFDNLLIYIYILIYLISL